MEQMLCSEARQHLQVFGDALVDRIDKAYGRLSAVSRLLPDQRHIRAARPCSSAPRAFA